MPALVDIPNVGNQIGQFNFNLKPFMAFGIVPIVNFQRRVANFGGAAVTADH